MFQIMEHKTKAVKMNDEINRNYCDDKKYIVKKKNSYSPKAITHLRRRDTFQIEVISRLNGLFENLVDEEE